MKVIRKRCWQYKVEAKRCPICKLPYPEADPTGIAHMMVAHGPHDSGASKWKRTRVRNILAKFHRRLEAAGFDEVQSHHIVSILTEELRKAGLK